MTFLGGVSRRGAQNVQMRSPEATVEADSPQYLRV